MHSLEPGLDIIVDELKVDIRDLQEVDGLLVEICVTSIDTISHVLIHVLGDERSDTGHKKIGREESIEEDVQADLLLFDSLVTLHSRSVESDVPVGELLQEGEKRLHNIVKVIVIELISGKLEHVSSGGDNPSVHEVILVSKLELELVIVSEVTVVILLVS